MGLAVPANMVIHVTDSLVKTGKVVRGYLGVNIQNITPALVESFDLKTNKGALVSDVVPDAPAAKAVVQVPEEVAPRTPNAPPPLTFEQRLAEQLAQAESALQRGELASPPGRSAVDLFRGALEMDPSNTLAKAGLIRVADRLLTASERAITAGVLTSGTGHHDEENESPEKLVDSWTAGNGRTLERAAQLMTELRAVPTPDAAMLSVALRELRALA